MKLRLQLLLLSVSILVLPWSGCQFVKKMEVGQRQAQLALAQAKAQLIAQQLVGDDSSLSVLMRQQPLASQQQALDVIRVDDAAQSILFDGELSDWQLLPEAIKQEFAQQGNSLSMAAASQQQYLYLSVGLNVASQTKAAAHLDFQLISGERIRYQFELDNAAKQSRLAEFELQLLSYDMQLLLDNLSSGLPLIKAYWINKAGEINLEIEINRALLNELRLDALSFSASDDNGQLITSSALKLKTKALVLQQKLAQLNQALGNQASSNLYLLDLDNYPLAVNRQLEKRVVTTNFIWQKFYRVFLGEHYFHALPKLKVEQNLKQNPITQAAWFEAQGESIARVVQPVLFNQELLGFLVLEQSTQAYLNLTEDAFGYLLLATLLSSLLVALGLVLYASFLSYRIKRLSQAAQQAVDDNGAVSLMSAGLNSKDELGDLARSYQALLARVKTYNDYLQGLGGKLSHELKTPLAIIKTSLDNLEHGGDDEPKAEYLQRAQNGAQRLSAILTALSSASRIENMIQHSQLEPLDVVPLLTQLTQAYQASFAGQVFIFESELSQCRLDLNADLLVQLLDKLVDNAVDFSPQDKPIVLCLKQEEHKSQTRIVLTLSNSGPLLPEGLQVFDSLVSARQNDHTKSGDTSSHLGLGLYIVKLIADFHQGEIEAYNRADQTGVVFKLTFN